MSDPDPGSIIGAITRQPMFLDAAVKSTWTDNVLQIVILLILIFVNAFFAMSEIAVISLNDTKMEKLAGEGNKKAKQVLKLTKNSSNFLSTIQIGVTLAGFLTSAFASSSFAEQLTSWIMTKYPNAPGGVIGTVSMILITILTSYFSLVLGELVPKKIAMQKPEKVSFAVVGVLLFVAKVTKPFVKILSVSTNLVVRLIGLDPNADEDSVTEEEILMMVDAGEEKGVIENTQAEMINNIFEFDDIDAGDLMTHRVDMTAVEGNDSIADVIKVAIAEGYSRIPVYDDDPDNIIGIVYVKDLLQYIKSGIPDKKTVREIMREAYFVPESKKCGELFTELIEKHIQIAIVVDEYGGTAGLITMEDLIESIVGNIQDEYDDEDDEVSKLNDNTFTVDGTMNIDEVCELINAELPEGEYDTLAGFLISKLGYLPVNGDMDVVEYKNIKFTVLSVEERRIAKVKIEITPIPEDDDEEQKEKERSKDKKDREKDKDKSDECADKDK